MTTTQTRRDRQFLSLAAFALHGVGLLMFITSVWIFKSPPYQSLSFALQLVSIPLLVLGSYWCSRVWARPILGDFRALQTNRDAATACLVVGFLFLMSLFGGSIWITISALTLVHIGFYFLSRARRFQFKS